MRGWSGERDVEVSFYTTPQHQSNIWIWLSFKRTVTLASNNGTLELEVTVSGGLAFTQQNILNARSGGANQVTQVINFDAAEICTVKVKRWPAFQRDVL